MNMHSNICTCLGDYGLNRVTEFCSNEFLSSSPHKMQIPVDNSVSGLNIHVYIPKGDE